MGQYRGDESHKAAKEAEREAKTESSNQAGNLNRQTEQDVTRAEC